MARRLFSYILTLLIIVGVAGGTFWAVRHFHKPGQLDVLTAQAMDMSAMRPPTGAAPVSLAAARVGTVSDTVTYTGSVLAFNEQDIAPRITGTILTLPVYPGDTVRADQIVAQLDAAEVSAKTAQAEAQARQAALSAQTARANHALHHQAALEQTAAQVDASVQAVAEARAQAQAAEDVVADAQAGVQSTQANADYWNTELVREKTLADAGAASHQEYQSEVSQSQAALSALSQARSKTRQAQAMVNAAHARIAEAERQGAASRAGRRMAQADLVVAEGQADTEAAAAQAAQAAAREAAIVQNYAQIASPIAGIVTARPVAPGTLVQPGTILLRVAQIDRVRVQAHVAAADLNGIAVGTSVQVVPQNGRAFAAKVTSVFPSADPQTRTATVEAVVPNPGHRLLPGAFVTLHIAKQSGGARGILVPATSVVSEGGASFVWLAQGGANAPTTRYKCDKCGMIYSAADAKKNNFRDPMDGGRLMPVMSPTSAGASMTARRVSVQTGASSGTWTQLVSGDVADGAQVVTHGQAGLTDGVALVASQWSAGGPLQAARQAASGATRYKCEKCGMIYSAADAKKHHYIDPMDGGKLVPVKG